MRGLNMAPKEAWVTRRGAVSVRQTLTDWSGWLTRQSCHNVAVKIGSVAERLKALVLKTSEDASPP